MKQPNSDLPENSGASGPEPGPEKEKDLQRPQNAWIVSFFALLIGSALMTGLYFADLKGFRFQAPDGQAIGNVTRAYGTVKRTSWNGGNGASSLDDHWNRMETGRAILSPIFLGDRVQTGENSAAELLFFGGSSLQIESASLAHFEDSGEKISIRLIMGRAFFEFPVESGSQNQFIFRKANGKLAKIPSGKRLMLTLNAIDALDEAVDVQVVESDYVHDSLADLELRYLAHGEEVGNTYAVIVPPIEDTGREPASGLSLASVPPPKPAGPDTESVVDIEANPETSFKWQKVATSGVDPVVGYEIIVKPAFGYNVEDRARKFQVFKQKNQELPIEKVGGGGVFLWSVRAVTASGHRGPASTKRWLEITFPKQLLAPQLIKPKVE